MIRPLLAALAIALGLIVRRRRALAVRADYQPLTPHQVERIRRAGGA
jgi:hypothetical protein